MAIDRFRPEDILPLTWFDETATPLTAEQYVALLDVVFDPPTVQACAQDSRMIWTWTPRVAPTDDDAAH